MIKDSLMSQEIVREEEIVINGKSVSKEVLWVACEWKGRLIALGVTYGRQRGAKGASEWNTQLFNLINQQIRDLQDKKYEVVLGGDLNIDITDHRAGQSRGAREVIEEMVVERRLQVVNHSEICQGQWTRSENGVHSKIDYFLVSELVLQAIEKMVIDEEDEMSQVQTDHHLVWVDIGGKWGNRVNKVKYRWDVTENTEWDRYRNTVK